MLTPKQEKFIQNVVSGMSQNKQIIKCLEVYMGDYHPVRQYAASILSKMILKDNYKSVMNQVKEELGFKINDTNISNGQCLCKKCHKMMHNDNEWIKYLRNEYGK